MGLLDYLKTQGEAAANDYAGLLDAYPNANKFLAGLLGNINQHIPSNEDFKSPAAMRDWSQAAALNAPMGLAIKAWHGSPHKFDKFDMSKIGTGEGAQAYGHGLYFAENPEIAEGYKKALSGGSYVDKRGMPVQPNEIASDIYEAARKGGAGVDEASDASSFWSLYLRDGDKMSNSPGFKYIKDVIDGRGITFKDHGNLYKTSLEWPDPAREAADPLGPQHFLDWDKPLSEQNSAIKEALSKINNDYGFDVTKEKSGNDAWRQLENMTSAELSSPGTRHPSIMSRDLLDLYGIPGIRYLDGGSRGAGEGSYNYVIFDDKIPKIIERNGVPINKQLAGLLNNL